MSGRTAILALLVAGVAVLNTACEPINPCDEYVDYMCACHAEGDDGYDCETLVNTYENADPELQDDCQVALDDQIDQDDAEGLVCAADTGI